jgi:uncharacterized membrane protein (DUF2068 family)
VTSHEAYALHRRHWWGPWLVVALTTAFVPFELAHLVKHATEGRVLLLLGNVAVAAYLAWAALRARRAGHASRQ